MTKEELVLRPKSQKFLHSRDVAVGNGSDIGTEVSIKAVIVGYTRQLD